MNNNVSSIRNHDMNTKQADAKEVKMLRDELQKTVSEKLGITCPTTIKEQQLDVSLELCREYCRMMGDAIDKSKPARLKLDLFDKYIDSLNTEIKKIQEINKDLSKRDK